MNLQIEIDSASGFCFGVTTAIRKAEEELENGEKFYCLGDIVHNGSECERLTKLGLVTINHEDLKLLHNAKVLLRAHGEPPETYEIARRNQIEIIDATCPVVLQLQKRIKQEYAKSKERQIVIYGKSGHAEVLGLVGQTMGQAIVLEKPEDAARLDFHRDIRLFSQTTQPLDGFHKVVDYIKQRIIPPATFEFSDTICRQVSNRMPNILKFASRHDVIVFVCGKKSSNGRVLFEACKSVNVKTYQVDNSEEINKDWFVDAKSVGICGATSTPKWLMEECRERIEKIY